MLNKLFVVILLICLYGQYKELEKSSFTVKKYLHLQTMEHIEKGEFYKMLKLLQQPCFRPYLQSIFQGAQIKLKDQGKLFKEIRPYSRFRFSSHSRHTYGISHMIFWKDEDHDTRLQVEKTPFVGVFSGIFHARDYLIYFFTGQQQGILGTSEHTDQNPIIVQSV